MFFNSISSFQMFLNGLFFFMSVQSCCVFLFVTSLLLFLQLCNTERLPWVPIPAGQGSRSTEKIQVIASQMIPPKASALGGCTVVSYYQTLLQRAAECELQFAESSKLCRPPRAAPLLKHHHAEAGGFELDASGFCPLSLQR